MDFEDNGIFLKELSDYTNDLNPVKQYVEQSVSYVTKELNIDDTLARILIKEVITEDENVVDPIVTYNYRKDNGDVEVRTTKLLEYIADNKRNNYITAPSLTTYEQPSKEKSLHAEFLEKNISLRSKFKKEAFRNYQDGDMSMFNRNNNTQMSLKVLNNALSGSYASASTVLFNPSAHYTLTSITRTATSITNAITESIVSGNKYFSDPDTVLNYILSVITNVDYTLLDKVYREYNLAIPTTVDIINALKKSSDLYWEDEVFYSMEVASLLSKLSHLEKIAVMYTNDLYHMRKLNDGLWRDIITGLSRYIPDGVEDPVGFMGSLPEYITNMVHHICHTDIRGMKVNYKDMKDTPEIKALAASSKGVIDAIAKYGDIFKAFLRSGATPINVGYTKDMLREQTIVSDTDSTISAYDEWVEWYYGRMVFDNDAVGVAAAVSLLVSRAVEHNLKQLTANMNVPVDNRWRITYKPEFTWHSMTPMSASKHYVGDTAIREGNVYSESINEIKGSNLILSQAPEFVQKIGKEILTSMHKDIRENRMLSAIKYLTMAADLEREIISRFKRGDIDIFKSTKIKDKDLYAKGESQSVYVYHLLWNDVFGSRYAYMDEPPYGAIKVNTIFNTDKRMRDWLDELEDIEFKESLKNFMHRHKKGKIGVFNLPYQMVAQFGIPKELYSAVDIDRVVSDSMSAIYMMLEGIIGFYRKDGMKLMDMGY